MAYLIRFNWSIILLLTIAACYQIKPQNENSTPVKHTIWNMLLQQHVDSLGFVNYKGFINDSIQLDTYLEILSENAPNDRWSTNEQLTYWINLYNAYTIKLIIKHYPLKSIKDIGASIQIPLLNTPWQIEFIEIGNKYYSLDDVEHNIIRENFKEPLIHFALVCAARSCPKLRNEAYQGETLEVQLTDQFINFLSDTSKNVVSKKHIEVSKIFWWFKDDFTKKTSLIEYLNQYAPIEIDVDAQIEYKDYNWELNEK
ncbi:MAG: DUF547 domain-containing protein [Cyclobacteriaceae bacterium]|nr:DUF547 domain-containing protein [Cyclobacteriaceae bacterium]